VPRPPVLVRKGERYGRLTVIADRQGKEPTVLVRCDCGSPPKRVPVSELRRASGPLRSCGCAGRETRTGGARGPKAVVAHGHARRGDRHPLYDLWRDLRRRYPGRRVCARWRRSFAAFLEDVGERPDGCVLRRVDERRPWGPGNVAWDAASSRGSRNGQAKLDEQAVHRIRSYLARGHSQVRVAELFRISRSQVRRIARGEAWAHVSDG
jgi:predicted XRE-type DNA-binding protein